METGVKRVRGSRARATRRQIVAAAAELFVADGYHSTTLEQIARRAGVAVQTVYFHFGSKRGLLKEAVDVAAVGDDEPVAMLERPWRDEAAAERDPGRVLALWVAYGRDVLVRTAPIMRVVRDAAAVDPDMAEQWAANQSQTATAFRALADQLESLDALRVPIAEATDILCVLSGIDLYLVLAARGWTPERWERFTLDALRHALLAEPSAPRP